MSLVKKTTKFCTDKNLITENDSILIALSGGPDSVALVHLLDKLRSKLKLSLAAVYVNHNLRPKAAKAEEKFCQSLCDNLDIDLTIVSEDIKALAKSEKLSIEEAARNFRYAIFEQIATEDSHNKIALGHHADDQAETVLFRIIRGTGTAGLAGIPARRGKIIRPLLQCTKAEIIEFLESIDQDYCLDSSNRSDDFSRNYIRNKLLPDIRERFHQSVDKSLISLSQIAQEESRYLEKQVDKLARKLVTTTPGGKIALDLNRWDSYDRPLRFRLLRRCLKAVSGSDKAPVRKVVERLDKFCADPKSRMSLPGQLTASVYDQKMYLHRPAMQVKPVKVQVGKRILVDSFSMTLKSSVVERKNDKIPLIRQAKSIMIDYETVKFPLELRNPKPRERFSPLGLGGTKKVSDYLSDRKLPAFLRDEVVALSDTDGIIWLLGYEIDDRVKIGPKTGKVLKVEHSGKRKKAIS